MFFIGLGAASPPRRYAQREAWEALNQWAGLSRLQPRSRAILKKVLCGDNGIESRHLALEPLTEVFEQNPNVLQARFARHAPALATEAARRAPRPAPDLPAATALPAAAPALLKIQRLRNTYRTRMRCS